MAKSKAILEIITDLTGLDKGLGHATSKVFDFQGAVKTAGAALVGAFAVTSIATAAADIVGFAGEVTDMSAKTGIGIEALQEFKYAAEQSGFELTTLTTGIGDMQKRLAGGDASAVGAIKALGLSLDDIRAMAPEEQFKTLAARVAEVEDPADRVKVAMDLFGDSGRQMLPLLTEDLEALTGRAQNLGLVMDEETVASMDLLGDTVSDLMMAGQALLARVLEPFIPLLTSAAEGAIWLAGALGDGLGWAVDKITDGLTWLALKIIEVWKTEVAFAQSIADAFPWMAQKLGITEGLATASQWLADAERALTKEQDDSTESTEKASKATERLNLNYRANAEAAKKAKEETAKWVGDLRKVADSLPKVGAFDGVQEWFAGIMPRNDDLLQWGKQAGFSWSAGLNEGVNADNALLDLWDNIERTTIGASEWGEKSGWSFSASFTETVLTDMEIVRGLERAMGNAGDAGANALTKALGEGLDTVTDAILGALQGGGNVLEAAAAALGSKIGAGVGRGIGNALGGPAGGEIGAKIGAFVGSLTGKIFSGNDTKKAREQAAKMLGFPSLSALYTELRTLGEEGAKLVHEGLNVIGKKDTAANDAWIRSVEELIARNKELAATGNTPEGIVGFPTKAELDAAAKSAGEAYAYMRDSGLYTADVLQQAWDKWQEALVASGDAGALSMQKLTNEVAALDDEFNTLAQSIADEAPEEVMGVIEEQSRARMAAIEDERKELAAHMAEQQDLADQAAELHAKKVVDQGAEIHRALSQIFAQTIEIPYVFRNDGGMPTPGVSAGRWPEAATFGGAMEKGGFFHVTRPTYFLAGEKPGGEDVMFSGVGRRFASGASNTGGDIVVPVTMMMNDREFGRATARITPDMLRRAGW